MTKEDVDFCILYEELWGLKNRKGNVGTSEYEDRVKEYEDLVDLFRRFLFCLTTRDWMIRNSFVGRSDQERERKTSAFS
jgi:hypothetical protein